MDLNRKAYLIAAICSTALWVTTLTACSSKTESEKIADRKNSNKQVESKLPEGCSVVVAGDYYLYPDGDQSYRTQSVLVVSCKDKKVESTNTAESCGKSLCPKTNVLIHETEKPKAVQAKKLELPANATLIESNRDERRKLIQNLLHELKKMDAEEQAKK